jgi:hypothetical protein
MRRPSSDFVGGSPWNRINLALTDLQKLGGSDWGEAAAKASQDLGGWVKEPWWSRTGIEPTDLLIKSGAPPLSYGPVTKDAGTMPECSSVSN